MKLVLNTRELTISNSSAVLSYDGGDGGWYDYPGHLGYCSRTGLNRTPKFIPEDHAFAMTKGRTIFDLVLFLKSLKGSFYDADDIDFETCLFPNYFMEVRNDLTLTDKDFPRDLKLVSAAGLQKELMRWIEFRVNHNRIQPCKNGDVGHVAQKATYLWMVETGFAQGHYLTTDEVNTFVDSQDGWTGESINGTLQFKNSNCLIDRESETRWFVKYFS